MNRFWGLLLCAPCITAIALAGDVDVSMSIAEGDAVIAISNKSEGPIYISLKRDNTNAVSCLALRSKDARGDVIIQRACIDNGYCTPYALSSTLTSSESTDYNLIEIKPRSEISFKTPLTAYTMVDLRSVSSMAPRLWYRNSSNTVCVSYGRDCKRTPAPIPATRPQASR